MDTGSTSWRVFLIRFLMRGTWSAHFLLRALYLLRRRSLHVCMCMWSLYVHVKQSVKRLLLCWINKVMLLVLIPWKDKWHSWNNMLFLHRSPDLGVNTLIGVSVHLKHTPFLLIFFVVVKLKLSWTPGTCVKVQIFMRQTGNDDSHPEIYFAIRPFTCSPVAVFRKEAHQCHHVASNGEVGASCLF